MLYDVITFYKSPYVGTLDFIDIYRYGFDMFGYVSTMWQFVYDNCFITIIYYNTVKICCIDLYRTFMYGQWVLIYLKGVIHCNFVYLFMGS
jgi:hypothetical protein